MNADDNQFSYRLPNLIDKSLVCFLQLCAVGTLKIVGYTCWYSDAYGLFGGMSEQ